MTEKKVDLLVELDDRGGGQSREMERISSVVWHNSRRESSSVVWQDSWRDSRVGHRFEIDEGLHVLDGWDVDLVLLGGELDQFGVSGSGSVSVFELLSLKGGLLHSRYGVQVWERVGYVTTTTTGFLYCWFLSRSFLVDIREFSGLEGTVSCNYIRKIVAKGKAVRRGQVLT